MCALIVELAGGELASGTIDVGAAPPGPPPVRLKLASVRRMLGDGIDARDVLAPLAAFGFGARQTGDEFSVSVPTHRKDIEVEADLIEEIARARGYDTVALEVPFHGLTTRHETRDPGERRVRDAMVSLGFCEVLTSSFVSPTDLERVGVDPSQAPSLTNPLNRDVPLLRPTAVPGLLDVVLTERERRREGPPDLRDRQGLHPRGRETVRALEAWRAP